MKGKNRAQISKDFSKASINLLNFANIALFQRNAQPRI
jgi:hypothetical protein